MKKLFFILPLLLISLSGYAQEPYAIAPKHYGLVVTADYDEEKLKGLCGLTLSNESAQPVDSISLLLYRLMKVTEVTDDNDQPLRYRQNVTEFDDFGQLQVNQIYVYKTLQPGESTTIKLYYEGYLLGYAETGMQYIKDRVSPAFTLIRFDTYAYPYPCLPSFDVLRQSVTRKFDYTLMVNVPDSLVAANGGKLVAKLDENGISTFEYESKLPAWRIDIAIASYKRLRAEGIDIFYFGSEEAAKRLSGYGEKCMQLYAQWWGKLKSELGMTIIETEEGSGGQTDETTILLPSESFNKEKGFEYLYHELSHLWNVSIQEQQGLSPRWEEGLATFCQVLAAEKLGNEPKGYAKERANRNIRWLNAQVARNEQLRGVPMVEYGNKDMTGYSYTHGAILFATLYYWLGDETFNKLVGGFYQQYYKNGASTKMFTDYCIKHSKNKQLKALFDDWLYTTGYTKYLSNDTTVDDIIAVYKK